MKLKALVEPRRNLWRSDLFFKRFGLETAAPDDQAGFPSSKNSWRPLSNVVRTPQRNLWVSWRNDSRCLSTCLSNSYNLKILWIHIHWEDESHLLRHTSDLPFRGCSFLVLCISSCCNGNIEVHSSLQSRAFALEQAVFIPSWPLPRPGCVAVYIFHVQVLRSNWKARAREFDLRRRAHIFYRLINPIAASYLEGS